MIKQVVLSLLVASTMTISPYVIDAAAQTRTKGEELERRQNQRIDDWATREKQQVREHAESRANNWGVGREKQVQDREREIDRQAAERKKEYAEARDRLPREKMNEPYVEKNPQTTSRGDRRQ